MALNTKTLTYVILELELSILFDFRLFYKLHHKIRGVGLKNIFQPYHFLLKYLCKVRVRGVGTDMYLCVRGVGTDMYVC